MKKDYPYLLSKIKENLNYIRDITEDKEYIAIDDII